MTRTDARDWMSTEDVLSHFARELKRRKLLEGCLARFPARGALDVRLSLPAAGEVNEDGVSPSRTALLSPRRQLFGQLQSDLMLARRFADRDVFRLDVLLHPTQFPRDIPPAGPVNATRPPARRPLQPSGGDRIMRHTLVNWFAAAALGGVTMMPAAAFAVDDAAGIPPDAVRIFVDQLLAHRTTENGTFNSRDEVKLTVSATHFDAQGQPISQPAFFLPAMDDDDYYEFESGTNRTTVWSNQDGNNVGKPSLWHKPLNDGEAISVVVVVREQDNKSTKPVVDGLKTGLDIATGIKPTIAPYTQGAKKALDLIPTHTDDDVIGSFNVVVKRMRNTYDTTITAIDVAGSKSTLQGGVRQISALVGNLGFTGGAVKGFLNGQVRMLGTSNGDYSAIVQVTTGRTERTVTTLGTTEDGCGRDLVTIPLLDRTVTVRKGETVFFTPIKYEDMRWRCGSSNEEVSCPASTNYMSLRRSGRDMYWTCMRENVW
jgi:hypothetical protein